MNPHQRQLSLVEQDLRRDKIAKVKRKHEDLELLAMKKPTTLDDIRARIPTPRETLPCNALPDWKERRLDAKFPAVPAPDGTFLISQGEVGRKLFVSTPYQDFDIRDPLIKETPLEYQSLHDPNLREYFHTNPVVCRQLVELGLVSNDGKVICSLNDFNKYRNYLGRVHNGEVARVQRQIEEWEKNDHETAKMITRSLKNAMKKEYEELRKQRREKKKTEIEERNRQRKLKALEHPSNYLKEKRLIEAKLRKARRDSYHRSVMDRLKRIKDADKRRARHLLLEWICRDQFREKLRCVINLEKELNKQENLAEFVENKRNFQEKKQRYHKALLQREKIEIARRVKNREETYARQQADEHERTFREKELVKERSQRQQYLMDKYGRKWLDVVRRNRKDAMHDSAWHIRNTVRAVLQFVKAESGAKNFSEYLQHILAQNKAPSQIDPETKKAVKRVLDTLIDRSYKEFIRRATSCLVDFVVDESRKRCLSFVCEAGLDPQDLQAPIIPKGRRAGQIMLPKPTYPLDGPCTHFARTGEWPQRCVQELQQIHRHLCNKLLKKLTCGMRRARKSCGGASLDRLEDRARRARGSQRVCNAVNAVSRMAMERAQTCFKPPSCERTKRVEHICDDLVGAVLGPSKPAKGKASKGRMPSRKKGRALPTEGVGPALQRDGLGRALTADASTRSDEYATSDSEVDGARIVPAAHSKAGPDFSQRGTSSGIPRSVDEGTEAQVPPRQDKSMGQGAGMDKATLKAGPQKAPSKTTTSDPTTRTRGIGPRQGRTIQAGIDAMGPGDDEQVEPEALVDSNDAAEVPMDDRGTIADGLSDEESTQIVPPQTEDKANEEVPGAADKGHGGLTAEDAGTANDMETTDSGTDGRPTKDVATASQLSPQTTDDGSGKPLGLDKGTEGEERPATAEGTETTGTTDAKVGEPPPPTSTAASGRTPEVDRSVGSDRGPAVDQATSGAPAVDKGTEQPPPTSASEGTQGKPAQDKGTGEPSKPLLVSDGTSAIPTSEQGTSETGPATDSTGAGEDAAVDEATEGPSVPTETKSTDVDKGTNEGTQGTPEISTVTQGTDVTSQDTATEPYPPPAMVSQETEHPTGVDTSTEKPGEATSADGTETEGPELIDEGVMAKSSKTNQATISGQPEQDAGTGPETPERNDTGTSGEPPKESQTQSDKPHQDDKDTGPSTADDGAQADGQPQKDMLTSTQPDRSSEAQTDLKPVGETKGTSPDSGREVATEPPEQPAKEQGTEPGYVGKDEGSEAVPSGNEAGTEARPAAGEDVSSEAAPPPGNEEGTESSRADTEDAGNEPDRGLEEETGPEVIPTTEEETQRQKDETKSEGVGREVDRDESEGTGPLSPGQGTDTQTPPPDSKGVGEPGEGGVDVGVEGPLPQEEGTEAAPETGVDVDTSTIAPEKVDQGLGPGAGAEEAVMTEEEPPCAVRPCICELVCPPDPWDGAEVTEGDLEDQVPGRVDELLDSLHSEMYDKCMAEGSARGRAGRKSEGSTCDAADVELDVDDILTHELESLMDRESCLERAGEYLRAKCSRLSAESKVKCLEEAAKQLREQCLTLSPADREKCLAEVDKLLNSSKPESDDDLSRVASGFVEAIIKEQRAKLSYELAVIGSGDEAAIERIISDDNVSRIASALVKQSICKAKCGPDNWASIGNVTPSPGVQYSVRDKLQHIRSILDEVKSDLAEVGIRSNFSTSVEPHATPQYQPTTTPESLISTSQDNVRISQSKTDTE